MSIDEPPKAPPSIHDDYRATARRLALGIALPIVWGSLYPLEFQPPTGAQPMTRRP